MMTVEDVRRVLGARVLVGEQYLDREVRTACGADMMSDVLAFIKKNALYKNSAFKNQFLEDALTSSNILYISSEGSLVAFETINISKSETINAGSNS